jgi:uncharacterized protein (DUF1778 family)
MAKTRISISLDAEQAERIRAHAERAGMDVSAFLVNAAIRQMTEVEAVEARFAGIDAVIAKAEEEAAALPAMPEVTDADLTEEERRRVQEVRALIFGTEGATTPLGDAA